MKKTLICKQGLFGGTDLLLSRYENWLLSNNCLVKTVDVNNLESLKDEVWDVVILPSSEINTLYLLYKNNVNFKGIIIYILGMGTLSDSYFNPARNRGFEKYINMYLKKMSIQFLDYLVDKNSIVFTDTVGQFNTLKDLNINIIENENTIIPIGISMPKCEISKKKKNSILQCCWIGRVSKDFKMRALQDLLYDIHSMKELHNIVLTIVGEGDGLSEVKDTAKRLSINVEFINNIEYDKIGDFLENKFDLCIAMGTSALDCAKYGISTIVLSPVRETDTEKANYRWIYESKGYSLGEYVGEKNVTNQIQKNLSTVVDEFFCDSTIDSKCRLYSEKFSEEKVFKKLYEFENAEICNELIKHVRKLYYLKEGKNILKKMLKRM